MNITINDARALNILVQGIGEGPTPPKTDRDGVQKLTDKGQKLYKAPVQVLKLDEQNKIIGVDSTVYISLTKPTEIEFGRKYRLAGATVVKHFVSGDRASCSITCEGLEPVDGPKPAVRGEGQ